MQSRAGRRCEGDFGFLILDFGFEIVDLRTPPGIDPAIPNQNSKIKNQKSHPS
jgi:hypothetical protein